MFVLFVVSGADLTTRAAFGGHRSREGYLGANQAMPVQVRLTAPFSKLHNVCGVRQLAQLGLQNLADSGQHRDAVPLSLGCSIIQEVTRLANERARRKAVAVHHFSNRGNVENPESLISSLIMVRLHVPQPLSRGGRSLKTRAGL